MTNEPWMRDLQEGYIRSLPAKIGEIRVLLDRVREAPGDRTGVRALCHAVRRLAGSAGTYGFPAISGALSQSARFLALADDGVVILSERELADLSARLDEVASGAPAD